VAEDEGVFDSGGADHEASFGGGDAHHIIANTIDPMEWKMELERVGPKLKASGATLGKEWRAHIEQTKEHEKTIQAVLPSAQGHMKNISDQIKEAVEKMRGKEQSLNNQFEQIRSEFEELTAQYKSAGEKQSATQASVGAMANSMGQIQEQLDEIELVMAGRENSATDTSPLVNIKQALVTIKGDVQQFDLRIGVVSNTLLQAKLKVSKRSDRRGDDEAVSKQADDDDDDDLDLDGSGDLTGAY
jgi:estrogen-related receptor beta like 1